MYESTDQIKLVNYNVLFFNLILTLLILLTMFTLILLTTTLVPSKLCLVLYKYKPNRKPLARYAYDKS